MEYSPPTSSSTSGHVNNNNNNNNNTETFSPLSQLSQGSPCVNSNKKFPDSHSPLISAAAISPPNGGGSLFQEFIPRSSASVTTAATAGPGSGSGPGPVLGPTAGASVRRCKSWSGMEFDSHDPQYSTHQQDHHHNHHQEQHQEQHQDFYPDHHPEHQEYRMEREGDDVSVSVPQRRTSSVSITSSSRLVC